jgi:excinuclease UvrABC ATPase subunit
MPYHHQQYQGPKERGNDPNSKVYNSPENRRAREVLRKMVNETIDKAAEVCQCEDCTRERLKKEMRQCDLNAIIEHLPSKMIRDPPGFTTELSPNPNYWKLGRRG